MTALALAPALSVNWPPVAGAVGALLLTLGLCVIGVAVVWEWKNRRDRK